MKAKSSVGEAREANLLACKGIGRLNGINLILTFIDSSKKCLYFLAWKFHYCH